MTGPAFESTDRTFFSGEYNVIYAFSMIYDFYEFYHSDYRRRKRNIYCSYYLREPPRENAPVINYALLSSILPKQRTCKRPLYIPKQRACRAPPNHRSIGSFKHN